MKEALLYKKLPRSQVQCQLCNHYCTIPPGGKGICGVRENRDGVLYSLVYRKLISYNIDPIEKKPFYHLAPGSTAFSIATVGCNFRCIFCQNWEISQFTRENPGDKIPGEDISPQQIVQIALGYGTEGISYTYTEPTIFFEYAYETAILATEKDLYNTFVTNGYMSTSAIEMIAPYLDGANVDLKSFNEDFYKNYCGASLKPVLKNIEKMKELGIWVEVTTLIIPTLNDSNSELRKIAQFLYNISPDIPWHVSSFYPHYKLTDLPPTPKETVKNARQIGLEVGLKYVYTGNIYDDEGSRTYCPSCKKALIHRTGFSVTKNIVKDNHCPYCNTEISGITLEGR